MSTVTCIKCGEVHFALSREDATNEVAHFNEYFNSLSKNEQDDHYGGHHSDIKSYERCGVCGNSYKNFRPSVEGDCPDGCTLSPIIKKED